MFQTKVVEITLHPSYTFTAWTGVTLSYQPVIAVKNQTQLLSLLKTSVSLGQSIILNMPLKPHGPSVIANVIINNCFTRKFLPEQNVYGVFFHVLSIIFLCFM